MPEQDDNVHPIDAVAHSAATDTDVLQLHRVVMESDTNPEVPGEMVVAHWAGVVIVRDEVADVLRAAAEWMDKHSDMVIDGITIERHHASGGREANEVRFFVRHR